MPPFPQADKEFVVTQCVALLNSGDSFFLTLTMRHPKTVAPQARNNA
jgi:hypothetical protein